MTETLTTSTSGIAHFIGQADAVGLTVLAVLVAMSMASWTVIVVKGVGSGVRRRRSRRFVARFREAPAIDELRAAGADAPGGDPFADLVREAASVVDQLPVLRANPHLAPDAADTFVGRAIARSLATTATRLETGLTVLASVGSAAPFVGLFGTVWGIYHALLAIGDTGRGTLDQVAGPVGEALIMTAFGLVVAIPAVLAYNAFVRSNRVTLAGLDAFAHDVHGRILLAGR